MALFANTNLVCVSTPSTKVNVDHQARCYGRSRRAAGSSARRRWAATGPCTWALATTTCTQFAATDDRRSVQVICSDRRGNSRFVRVWCNNCSPGKYSNRSGNQAEEHCSKCTPGKYLDEAGRTECKTCSDLAAPWGARVASHAQRARALRARQARLRTVLMVANVRGCEGH